MNGKSVVSLLKKIFNWKLLKETYKEWSDDKASRLAAALAYYTATALAPLIVGVLAIVAFVFDREQAQLQLVSQVRTNVGAQGAEIVETILSNADQPDLARLAGIFSLVALVWSASNIFAQLQDSLDTIWGVELRKDLSFIRKAQHRLLPLLTVFGIGVLLLVALVATTALTAVGSFVTDILPGGALLWQIVNFFISLTVITLLFGVILNVLPNVKIAWADVWPGAALTALLFIVGQYVLSWYLGRQSGASLYGAAGSLIILLLWLYYSAQIFLFGAEFTQVYATRYGEGVLPAKDAVARDENAAQKPAARVAKSDATSPQTYASMHNAQRMALVATTSAASAAYLDSLPVGRLVVELLRDYSRLLAQEIQLIRTEINEAVTHVARGIALLSGGALLAYGGLLLLLTAIPLLVWSISAMPLWLAFLLVGILLLIEGWILMVWARKRLQHFTLVPKQSIESVREDGETIRDHVVS